MVTYLRIIFYILTYGHKYLQCHASLHVMMAQIVYQSLGSVIKLLTVWTAVMKKSQNVSIIEGFLLFISVLYTLGFNFLSSAVICDILPFESWIIYFLFARIIFEKDANKSNSS